MTDSLIPYAGDPAAVSGNLITVDQYVNDPTVITRVINQLASQRFYANTIFSPGPNIEGGALLFERPNPLLTDLYAGRRTQEIAPGTQFPVQKFVRGVPMVQTPRKIGEKFEVTKEDRKRNRVYVIDNAITQAANTLARDVEIIALSELASVIASTTRTTAAAATWASYVAITYNSTTKASQPLSDIIAAKTIVDLEERNTNLNAAILNPTDVANLVRYYGADGVSAALASAGIDSYYSTPRQPQGRVKLYERGSVGVWSNEFPLDQSVWWEQDIESWWYQWSYSPLFAVTNQYKTIEITGV